MSNLKNPNETAHSIAMALGRRINHEIDKLASKRTYGAGKTGTENPFARVSRGKNDDARRMRNLEGALGQLGAANERYMRVFAAYVAACDELATATDEACGIVGVTRKGIAESLANVGSAPTALPTDEIVEIESSDVANDETETVSDVAATA
jgi:hypothetical protein